MTTAFYAGTFDPITNGHLDIIQRGARLFERLVIGVAENPSKQPWFSLEERIQQIQSVTQGLPNIEVRGYKGLLVDTAKGVNATVILRGLRSVTDFEFEMPIANINYDLDTELETIFLTSRPQHVYISSSLVKNTFAHGGEVKEYLPSEIYASLLKRQAELRVV